MQKRIRAARALLCSGGLRMGRRTNIGRWLPLEAWVVPVVSVLVLHILVVERVSKSPRLHKNGSAALHPDAAPMPSPVRVLPAGGTDSRLKGMHLCRCTAVCCKRGHSTDTSALVQDNIVHKSCSNAVSFLLSSFSVSCQVRPIK